MTKPTAGESIAAMAHRLAIEANPPKPPAAWLDAKLRNELATLRAAKDGGRNIRLNQATFALAKDVGAGWRDEADIDALLVRVATKELGLPYDEVHKTMRSAMDAGKLDPSQWEA